MGVRDIENKIRSMTQRQLINKKASKHGYGIGDKVRLKNGQIGTILYVTKEFFTNNQIVYGLRLNEWSPNGHDGSYDGVRYFEAPHGYAYFAIKYLIQMQIQQYILQKIAVHRI